MEPDSDPPPKPRDLRAVESILRSMGVDSFDPRVCSQLLELLYRYVSNILLEARDLCEHAEKTTMDIDDIRLAIRSKTVSTFTQLPPRDLTMRLAAERNSIPLPIVDQRAGVALPPAEFQLTAQNYEVLLEASAQLAKEKELHSKGKKSSPGEKKAGLKGGKSRVSPVKSPGMRSAGSPGRSLGTIGHISPGKKLSPGTSVGSVKGGGDVIMIDIEPHEVEPGNPASSANTGGKGAASGDVTMKK